MIPATVLVLFFGTEARATRLSREDTKAMVECLAIMRAVRFDVMISLLETNRHLELRDVR
jgi:hypothetical protein